MKSRNIQKLKLLKVASESGTLTTSEAAALTGYAPDHIALIVRKGLVRGLKRGRDWLVNADSLLKYMEGNPKPGRRKKI